MRNMILAGLAITLAASPAAAATAPALMLDAEAPVLAAAKAAQRGGVRVWVDNHRDYFRVSDRLRVRVRSDYDSYLAVFHIDTNGDVDILYPRSEYDDGWVQRGRTLTLGSRGRYDYLHVRGGHGVGYVMAVALDEPLELWRVRDLYGRRFGSWHDSYSIYGDPFYAMDEIVRAVVPESSYGYESVDYYTYHIGRRYDYPRYACYDGYGDWYNDTYYSYYGRSRCDRVRVILINRPWYYDTYRWRGSRRVYYDRYYYRTARNRPLHGYKERTQGQAPPARSSTAQRRPSSSGGGSAPEARTGGGVRSQRPESTRPAREGTVSSRPETSGSRAGASSRRPETTDRATPSSRPERGTYEPRVRDRGEGRGTVEPRAGSSEPRASRPDRGSQPREESARPPQQDRPVEPQRERPTFQRRPERSNDQPRRESPPQRSAEPRRESPPARSSEPRRESPPARSSEPRRESSPPSRPSSSGSGSRTRPSDS